MTYPKSTVFVLEDCFEIPQPSMVVSKLDLEFSALLSSKVELKFFEIPKSDLLSTVSEFSLSLPEESEEL